MVVINLSCICIYIIEVIVFLIGWGYVIVKDYCVMKLVFIVVGFYKEIWMGLFVMLCEFVLFSNRWCYIDIIMSIEIYGRRLVKVVFIIFLIYLICCFIDLVFYEYLDVGCVRWMN